MIFPSWQRLVRLYEQRVFRLLSGRYTIAELFHAEADVEFQRAAYAVAADMVREVANVNAASWRAAAMKATQSRAIYSALQEEIQRTGLRPELKRIARENARLISSLPRQVAQRVSARSSELMLEGRRPKEIEAEIRALAPRLAKSRVRMIARTEVSKAETDLTRLRSERMGLDWYQWATSKDSRVRPSHRNMDAVLVAWDDAPQPERLIGERSTLGAYHAGSCPNCFTGDTEVGSPSGIKTLWRAPYSGDLVSITLENGIRFSATPNHPILTEHGWAAIGSLDVGNNLVHLLRTCRIALKQNVHQRIATFKDVFEAYSVESNQRFVPASEFDFHGDVVNGNVNEVSVTLPLDLNRQASRPQGFSELIFSLTHRWIAEIIAGIAFQIGGPAFACGCDECGPFGWGHSTHANSASFGGRSALDSIEFQGSLDSAALNLEAIGESLLAPQMFQVQASESFRVEDSSGTRRALGAQPGFFKSRRQASHRAMHSLAEGCDVLPGEKSVIRIAEKVVRKGSEHVFTLESGNGWYTVTSTGIIAQNCRCLTLPLVSLDEVRWPCRVHIGGRLVRMTRVDFARRFAVREAA